MKRRARVIRVWHSNCRKYYTKDPLSYSPTCLIPYFLASASSCFHYSEPKVWAKESEHLHGAPHKYGLPVFVFLEDTTKSVSLG